MLERIAIVRKKKLLALEAEHEKDKDGLRTQLVEQLNRAGREKTSLQNRVAMVEESLLGAQERTRAAEETCARVTDCHSTRVRIGSIPIFDAIEMTARIRTVEGSLRCETDGKKIVAYGDRQITEAEWNALVAAGTPEWNRT